FAAGEGVDRLVERDFLAEAVADVAEVAEGGALVADLHVAVQVADLAAADGFNEVAEMIAAGIETGDLLAIEVEGGAAGIGLSTGRDDVAFVAEPDIADAGALVAFGSQAADFEDDVGAGIFEEA